MSAPAIEQPGEGWTLNGIAFAQIGFARDDLITVQRAIARGHSAAAVEQINTVIRQLEAARRHLD